MKPLQATAVGVFLLGVAGCHHVRYDEALYVTGDTVDPQGLAVVENGTVGYVLISTEEKDRGSYLIAYRYSLGRDSFVFEKDPHFKIQFPIPYKHVAGLALSNSRERPILFATDYMTGDVFMVDLATIDFSSNRITLVTPIANIPRASCIAAREWNQLLIFVSTFNLGAERKAHLLVEHGKEQFRHNKSKMRMGMYNQGCEATLDYMVAAGNNAKGRQIQLSRFMKTNALSKPIIRWNSPSRKVEEIVMLNNGYFFVLTEDEDELFVARPKEIFPLLKNHKKLAPLHDHMQAHWEDLPVQPEPLPAPFATYLQQFSSSAPSAQMQEGGSNP